jgi:hypothetical protein
MNAAFTPNAPGTGRASAAAVRSVPGRTGLRAGPGIDGHRISVPPGGGLPQRRHGMLAPSRRHEPHGLQARTLMHLLADGVTQHHAKNGQRFPYAPCHMPSPKTSDRRAG